MWQKQGQISYLYEYHGKGRGNNKPQKNKKIVINMISLM